ncbi:MAG: hypothetical protein A2X08_04480 [Bacteroidetes bacterium GWA2_32_17]|nr:MAG: hypothetical protein A2X08_04480 [Bacteroidetes bacterium GWA2_32_17]
MKYKINNYLILTIIIFGLLYSLISLVNHYNFRTYALDLGAYTNAMYDYIHFQWNDSTVFNEIKENLLADHFDLYLIIFSPLSLIFKTYTLLIVQIFMILFGGIGVYRYFSISKSKYNVALLATIYFYMFFGVFSAVSFDYHSNVIAASLVPWFFYFFKQKKHITTCIILLLLLISKENISLWVAFICIGLLFEYKNDKISLRYLLTFFLISILYFILITSVVMPALSNSGTYPHFHYSSLGNNPFEVLKFIFSHPLESIKLLFVNYINHPLGNYVKIELHILVLTSGLFILFKKPHYILMLIPIYFQKLFNDNYEMWGIGGQYSIEFAPILAIGIFSVISEFKNIKLLKIVSVIALLGVISSTIRVMDNTVIFTSKSKIRFYQETHYKRDYDVKTVYEQLNKIPDNVIVSAQTPFLPHLSLRDNIYQFPIVKDAEYIIYSNKEVKYPLNEKEFSIEIKKILISNKWKTIFKSEDIVILKRKIL